MKVPLLDLKAQFESIADEAREAMWRVCESQRFIMGPEVQALEEEVATYCDVAHGVGVSSGTDALLVSLMALDIGAGDEVVTTPYTFFATAGCISRVGARPVFVDIQPETCNIDPGQIEAVLTPRTRAIMPVHLYGQLADMEPIMEIAGDRGLHVIEDAAQAIGAEQGGKKAGSIGMAGCFSFFPSKNLGAFGDGGMVVTSDEEFYQRCKVMRLHGARPKYHHSLIGGNFRLDALQAAVLRVKLPRLDSWTEGRIANAGRYDRLFEQSGLVTRELVRPPHRRPGRHIFNQYVIRARDRDALKDHLAERGISTVVYYPIPLHRQVCFSELGYSDDDLPESSRAAAETLALPVYPELDASAQEYVVTCIVEFYRARG